MQRDHGVGHGAEQVIVDRPHGRAYRLRLPVACTVETAATHESNFVAPLLDQAAERGVNAETVALDRGYDFPRV